MKASNSKDKSIQDWLSASASDLKGAKVLYDNKLFPAALYHLQQSNEKLAKGLLISYGLLTPSRAKKNLRIKSLIGFSPKPPESYRHRIMHSFLSDIEKLVPSIEEFYDLIENSEWKPELAEFRKAIRKGKKSIRKLKKKPFNVINTTEQIENEVKAIKNIVCNMDKTIDKVTQDIDKLDFEEIVRVAVTVLGKTGLEVNGAQTPSWQKTKEDVLSSLTLSILVTISVAMASFLDPLEAVTRYPDPESYSFNEKNPYVICFKDICELVALTLEKCRGSVSVREMEENSRV